MFLVSDGITDDIYWYLLQNSRLSNFSIYDVGLLMVAIQQGGHFNMWPRPHEAEASSPGSPATAPADAPVTSPWVGDDLGRQQLNLETQQRSVGIFDDFWWFLMILLEMPNISNIQSVWHIVSPDLERFTQFTKRFNLDNPMIVSSWWQGP